MNRLFYGFMGLGQDKRQDGLGQDGLNRRWQQLSHAIQASQLG